MFFDHVQTQHCLTLLLMDKLRIAGGGQKWACLRSEATRLPILGRGHYRFLDSLTLLLIDKLRIAGGGQK
ncbi:MAG: hypothetical protein AAF392_02330, partial [Bacteroidota bacterium]